MWCASLGFSEKRLAEAAAKQFAALPYYQNFAHRTSEPAIELSERLIRLAPVPMSKVLFQSSGSEANDTAIKLAWYYFHAIGKPAKRKIISRKRAYHGTSIASASLTGLPHIHRDFNLPLDGFLHVTCPHFYREGLPGETEDAFASRLADELEQLILKEGPDTVAAFFAEPVMGTGGCIVPPRGYYEKVQAILPKYEILFVVDEVICGFGRTGNWWGSQTFGLKPDMISSAKALTAAYQPLSALLLSEPIYQAMKVEADKIGVFGHGYIVARGERAVHGVLDRVEHRHVDLLLGRGEDVGAQVRLVCIDPDALKALPLGGRQRAQTASAGHLEDDLRTLRDLVQRDFLALGLVGEVLRVAVQRLDSRIGRLRAGLVAGDVVVDRRDLATHAGDDLVAVLLGVQAREVAGQ